MNYFERPVFGLVVEGHAEYKSFPSLISRILDVNGLNLKVLNARGFGSITSNLDEHLTDLARFSSPHHIIVTVDLIDTISNRICENCNELLEMLSESIDNWILQAQNDDRIDYLPESIVPVIQIQNLESWMISDPHNLSDLPVFDVDLNDCNWENVDDEIRNPKGWLIDKSTTSIKVKKPSFVNSVFSASNVDIMIDNSRSFNKFSREVLQAYENWCNKLENLN